MTKNFYIAAFVVSMLAFSSCKIGKRYARPELNLPDRIEAYTDTTDTASVENIPWESLYADETLKDLIKKALDNNKDMKIAAAKVKEMIAAKRISFANMLPEVGANIYAQKERLNYGGDDPKPDPEFGAKLTLSWELDLWGNLRWANEATIASYMQTVEGQRALRLTIIAEVAANYYQLCALDQELSIVQQTLDARREGVRLAKLRYEGGLTSETEVGANIYAQKERLNYGGDDPKPDPEFGAKLTLSWELDLWGNLRWANEATIASYMQTVEGQRALRLTIIAEVAANYYQLCALDQELSIVQQTLDARREGVRLAKLRYEGGLTSETAYNQAQVELARTETLIPSLERQIKIKESDLSMLLGEYTDDIPRGLSLSDQHLPDALPIGLPSSLLERRPDMRQAEFKLRAANAQVGVAQTDLFPKIRLTSNYGFESDELSSILKSPAGFIAGSLLQPIFAMGKNKAKVKAAKARYEQEVYSYEKSVLGAFKEVNNAIVTVRKVKEIRASRMNLEASASKYLELAQLQYINGVISYMDVLDAQRGLLDAQIGLNNAVLDELLSVVYLYKALGGGF